MLRSTVLAALGFAVVGCGISDAQRDKLEAENKALKDENERLAAEKVEAEEQARNAVRASQGSSLHNYWESQAERRRLEAEQDLRSAEFERAEAERRAIEAEGERDRLRRSALDESLKGY